MISSLAVFGITFIVLGIVGLIMGAALVGVSPIEFAKGVWKDIKGD